MSRLSELGMVYVCSGCGATTPGYSADSVISNYCNNCGNITEWYYVSLEGVDEREQMFRRIRRLFGELVERLDYTTILTDTAMIPQVINGVSVPDTIHGQRLRSLLVMTQELDREHTPIPITDHREDTVGFLHYGSDDLERELLLLPYVEIGIFFVLILLFFYVIRMEMKKEKELSWIGFAKETAHQISTPLTSLMGWIELLRDKPETQIDKDFTEALEYIEKDVDRLKQIASRYGQMGKKPRLESCLVNPVILDVVHYFSGRQGFLADNMNLETVFESEFPVNLNRVLFSWVIENHLKNSIASLKETENGVIRISTRDIEEGSGIVEIEIADNGKGIPFSDQKKVFKAGFSTRQGGWGLGLTLSKRIVEQYHNGILRLEASSPGKGTTFQIILPALAEDGE